jgi:hypothetical protein
MALSHALTKPARTITPSELHPADVDGEDQTAVGGLRHGQGGQHLPQPRHIDVPAVQRVMHDAVAAPVLGHQRQIHRRPHWPIRA